MSKRLYSAYINADAFSVLEELARYRSMFLGEKNSRGQPIGASTLIDEAVVKYVEAHTDEVNQYRKTIEVLKSQGVIP